MIWIFILITTLILLYWKVVKPLRYWDRVGVRNTPISESLKHIFKPFFFSERVQYVYNKFPKDRYIGIYQITRPILLIRDEDLIRTITVKDFDHFTDHTLFLPDEDHDLLWSRNLFSLRGQRWRHMRSTLSPAFTSSKMKAMFQLMTDCAQQFIKYFEEEEPELIHVDLKEIFTRYANDVIGTCAFGVQCNSMAQKDNYFYTMGKKVSNTSGFWNNFKILLMLMTPPVARIFKLKLFTQDIYDFFINLIRDTTKLREEQNIYRPDMIHLLMEAKKGNLKYDEDQKNIKETGFATVEESGIGIPKDHPREDITLVDMTAQALLFFFAGFDSISNLMSFMGYEIALNPDVQQKLYEEIQTTIEESDGKVTYEALNKMKYLDMVVAETLRKWPMVASIDRVCTKEYTIDPQNENEVPVTLKTGDIVWIPIWGIHYNAEYYPNPNKFDPERFSDENKANIKPFTYLPFGAGPRNCIGSRFALLEAKAGLFYLLSKFEIVPSKDTPIPMVLRTDTFAIAPTHKFLLDLKRRQNFKKNIHTDNKSI